MKNVTIENILNCIRDLDVWSQFSVFGSWEFVVNTQCINQALKLVPDIKDGIDGFNEYKSIIADAKDKLSNSGVYAPEHKESSFASTLPSFLNLRYAIYSSIYEADGTPRDLEGTLEFLVQSPPSRETFGKEFDFRVRSGNKPKISRRDFIDSELGRAQEQFEIMRNKGDTAVQLCREVEKDLSLERGYDDLPDWVTETLLGKASEKLHTRWRKLDNVRSNPRRTKQIRDSAEADQMLVEGLLRNMGESVDYEESTEGEKQVEDMRSEWEK
jgi:hypothetical protein